MDSSFPVTNKLTEPYKCGDSAVSDHESHLARIDNVPEHPMDLFAAFKTSVEPHVPFPNVMCIATVNKENGVLNRNVLMRKFDRNGFVFVTERNSRKYADLKENPAIAATFLWIFSATTGLIYRQVRVNGRISELNEEEIAQFYQSEPTFARLRSQLAQCGSTIEWSDMKERHDDLLARHKNGEPVLHQTENYTAIRIIPYCVDFYYSRQGEIADRVLYEKNDDGQWSHKHIAA